MQHNKNNITKYISFALGFFGLLLLLLHGFGLGIMRPSVDLFLALTTISGSILVYAYHKYSGHPMGIKNDGQWQNGFTSRGWTAIVSGIIITGFYILLYFFPKYLGLGGEGVANTGLIALFDPLSQFLKGQPASQWFVYGVLYTIAIVFFGIKFIAKYRHNRYQQIRTLSVMFFQFGFAFLLPEILMRLNEPYYNFANMWPLNYYFFDQWHVDGLIHAGSIGMFMLIWGLLMVFVISPFLTYRFGKRWYCSWVCGCGGLAETAGDSFRHLSDNSVRAWKIERWMIHSVLVFSFVMTIAVISSYLGDASSPYWLNKRSFLIIVLLLTLGVTGGLYFFRRYEMAKDGRKMMIAVAVAISLLVLNYFFSGKGNIFFIDAGTLRSWYGFAIGAVFSGVIGVGFYPLMGNRVWCRFGCPMAAILGLQQKFLSRFRITTNGGQCISCGNCTTYCEMGIDVRSYAQKGEDILRASCVGCGICSAVCPRGVLRLENGEIGLKMG